MDLLNDMDFSMWTLSSSEERHPSIVDTFVCFSATVGGEEACILAALSLHALLPPGFPREEWNWAIGCWFQLGGTQREGIHRCLYQVPRSHFSVPLGDEFQLLTGRVTAHTQDGRVVPASIQNAAIWLGDTTSSDVWVSVFDEAVCPCVALRRTFAVECTGLGGADLNSPTPWDIQIRTGSHHEEVYGPYLEIHI